MTDTTTKIYEKNWDRIVALSETLHIKSKSAIANMLIEEALEAKGVTAN